MSRRSLALVALALVGLAAVLAMAVWKPWSEPSSERVTSARRPVTAPPPVVGGKVTVSGVVIDQATQLPVPAVEVVLRGAAIENAALTTSTGAFMIQIPPGSYRAFVRNDRVISVGMQDRVRLDNGARNELAGVVDEQLIPMLEVEADTPGIELMVMTAAIITGVVVDRDDEPVSDVVVRARALESTRSSMRPTVRTPIVRTTPPRPVLGSDTVISDEDGRFVLRLPAGRYELDATHPKFAGIGGLAEFELDAGQRIETMLTLSRGCIITGRVVTADETPANDGALEIGSDARTSGFGPSGRVEAGGRFRWTTTDESLITLRAWPWRSPPSSSKSFSCKDGARFNDVVLRLSDQRPDISGTIVDANGNPVPLAYVDIRPLDWALGGQQERADSTGSWHVYDMPAGRYKIRVSAPGRGVVETTVFGPRHDVRLQLGGTGRISGTTTELVSGSFEASFLACGSKSDPIDIAHDPRIVTVIGGRFTIDEVPACMLGLFVRWRDRVIETEVVVEPDRTVHVELDLGPPREKTVHGVVRDSSAKPVAGARVTAVLLKQESATVRTDNDGRYTLRTHSGAHLVAGDGSHAGRSIVGRANVTSEQVDLVLDDADDDH